MRRVISQPALIVHGGAGAVAPAAEHSGRRRGLLAAAARGAEILRGGGSALDAVLAAVTALEDDPSFNAGYGSVLTAAGRVEMDAALMVAQPRARVALRPRAGAVATITRVRNPILLARAVMDHTPHVFMAGAGAERIARRAGIARCRPQDLVTPLALRRLSAMLEHRATLDSAHGGEHGTVGAAAVDAHGDLAAATSTGGMTGKMPGRVGDSAVIGAGVYAHRFGAASATGVGEAIMKVSLCREAVMSLRTMSAAASASRIIARFAAETGEYAGIVIADRRGRLGYAHNGGAMEVAMFDGAGGVRYRAVESLHRVAAGAG